MKIMKFITFNSLIQFVFFSLFLICEVVTKNYNKAVFKDKQSKIYTISFIVEIKKY